MRGKKRRDVSVRRRNRGRNKSKPEVRHEATMGEKNILKRSIKIIMV